MKLKFNYTNHKIGEPWEKPENASWPQILGVDGGTKRVLIAWAEEVPDDETAVHNETTGA